LKVLNAANVPALWLNRSLPQPPISQFTIVSPASVTLYILKTNPSIMKKTFVMKNDQRPEIVNLLGKENFDKMNEEQKKIVNSVL